MRLVIETSRNGYIVRDQNDGSDPESITTVGEDDPVDATFIMLGEVLEAIGHIGSRHDERRVRITVEPGDKFEDSASLGDSVATPDQEQVLSLAARLHYLHDDYRCGGARWHEAEAGSILGSDYSFVPRPRRY